jgi:uncharacterized SAM-dependent methyltransferase
MQRCTQRTKPNVKRRKRHTDKVQLMAISKTVGAQSETVRGLQITALLQEREILDRTRKSFRERQLPEEVFYWFPASVAAWTELCRSTEYRNANRAIEVLQAAASEIAEKMTGAHAVCGLGCGEGSKDAILLESINKVAKRPVRYVGADFSQALLELALEEAGRLGSPVSGFKCDLGNEQHLASVCAGATGDGDSPVIFTVLGNTLGAFGAQTFPNLLRRQVRSKDWFVFDGEIFSDETLAGYDNPTNRRFAWGPLNGVGITDDDGKLEFATAPASDGLFAVIKHFIATRDIRVNLGGETITIANGEKLRMSSSIKYQSESVLLDCVSRAGFQIQSKWKSKDQRFVLAAASPR